MKLCRFDDDRLGLIEGGLVENDAVRDVTAALDVLPAQRWPVPPGDALIANLETVAARAAQIAPDARPVPLEDVTLKSPVANPGKIIGAPVNYKKHQDEANRDKEISPESNVKTIETYGLFLKASSALVGPGEGVTLRFPDRRTDHEAELAVIIGRGTEPGQQVREKDAFDHIAGYSIGLDMTIRGSEDRSLRKSIDSYAVLGPWLVTADEIADPDNLDFSLSVRSTGARKDGATETRQDSNTRHLIFGVAQLIAFASRWYTLHPGDILMTGTPEGVGPVSPGDTMVCELDGVGRMEVAVR